MSREHIIETYLNLSRKAQETEADWENGNVSETTFIEAADAAHLYFYENNITRNELTEYNDRKRNVVKASTVEEAAASLTNFFMRV